MTPLLRILITAVFAYAYAPGISAEDAKEGRGIGSMASSIQEQRLDCNSSLQAGQNTHSNAVTPSDNAHTPNGCSHLHHRPHPFFIPRTKANIGPSNTGADPAGAGR